jgi:hypothetical protein
MTFEQAVRATPSVRDHYRSGLQALASTDMRRVQSTNARQFTGSVNLDDALCNTHPDSPRWDYGIGFQRQQSQEVAVWVEVHPASSTSVTDILNKLRWLRNWLDAAAPKLKELTQGDYYWVATDAKIAITPGSPQAKRLAAAGIRGPVRVLKLA